MILASASPRRRELLTQIGIPYQVCPSNKEEIVTETEPEKIVMELSCQKAEEVAGRAPWRSAEKMTESVYINKPAEAAKTNKNRMAEADEVYIIIGADTLVFLDGKQMGKPSDEKDAAEMLFQLQGKEHQVYTGVTLLVFEDGQEINRKIFYERTQVEFSSMSAEEIDFYVKTGEPMGKAGAYAIQGIGSRYIKEIRGDYTNVVGLPLSRLYQELKLLEENL